MPSFASSLFCLHHSFPIESSEQMSIFLRIAWRIESTWERLGPIGHEKLFSDTKTAEYLAEQIVAGEFTGDLAQGVLSEPQVFGE
jgi:hypothetical protein